ncbi:precorrin-6y C5,15-methyltransferase (decarboxylating) subunit CbiE [Paractinoplanes atraurantiacus]|uniref:Precorrin-6Y C5,15-methyltransferase (Decarboxylating) n=1 Tax=Paractinoplanes atraurantiacus TaxID=1036182 RepID=A0A285IPR4_9ACTN|nr:precorrin-6y C5,15-methyltransferase (decarboxylating) subunit CbiE [Actinoplanes atraurantiacus]SNY50009.1 precorrin-6Y C5,15-methyltransferase (decarboxylating) [Actinoplanes atraurantiacus]
MRDGNPDLVTVVGIGAGGFDDLSRTQVRALTEARVILGSRRQLDLLPSSVAATRVEWPSPLVPALPGLFEEHAGPGVCVLASGDPMFHGIGATLVRVLGASRVRVLPHPSSVSLAAARLGWPLASVEVVSLVTQPVDALRRSLNPGRKILVLSRDASTPAAVAALLSSAGFSSASLTVLSQLGGRFERITSDISDADPLNVVAIDCGAGPSSSLAPGLPDSSYVSDGQLTKREVRAVTMSVLAPVPGALLWDVGAGSGSIGIEWMRSHPSCRAIAVESHDSRAATIETNAAALGVPGLQVVCGSAPGALEGLPTPDTIFIGGGLTRDGVLEACLAALRPGGRLVANAVTVESEAFLAAAYAKHGGEMTRVAINRASPVGGFTGWRAMMPVTIWSVTR